MTRRTLYLALLCTTLWLGACDSCGGSSLVPFKRDARTDTGKDSGSDAGRDAGVSFADSALREHDGGAQLRLGEHELSIPGARASLTLDIDRDGLPDALVWAGSKDAPPSLWYAHGSDAGFDPPEQVARSSVALAEGCDIDRAHFQQLTSDKAALVSNTRCETPDPLRARQHVLWLSLAQGPRVLERLALRDIQPEHALSLETLRAEDVDGDGHPDIRASLRVEALDAELRITWLDRPSGLARDAAEPEASLAALASAAEKLLPTDAAAAQRAAESTLTLHTLLCSESGQAALAVGDVWGLRCGRSSAAGDAALVAVQALASRGDVVGALHALEALERNAVNLRSDARTQALRALEAKATTPSWTLRPLAETALSELQPTLAPALRLSEGELWVATVPPRMWDVASGLEAPSLDVPRYDLSISDPSGRYRVRHVDRDCQGRLLRIEEPDGRTHHARARLEPSSSECQLRVPVPDAGDLRVLGWAPQGVVLSDDEGALLVPLDANAQPTEGPRRLSADVPLPAPLPPGRAAPSGNCHVRPTRFGVLLTVHGRDGHSSLIRPPGWEGLDGPPRDAVVDASCHRIALATSTRTYVLERKLVGGGETPSPGPAPSP